jgi:hypothetical protein
MMAPARFTISYEENVVRHLSFVDRRYHRVIRDVIEKQLTYQPLVETRNRKRRDPPDVFDADWELRCGPNNSLRVLYRVDVDKENNVREVIVLAIGIKERDRLLIAGEEY